MNTLPFDYDKYRNEGYKVVTRDGRKVPELYLFTATTTSFPLTGLLDGSFEKWTKEGMYLKSSDHFYDLFLLAMPVERWANLYADGYMSALCCSLEYTNSFKDSSSRIAVLKFTYADKKLTEVLTVELLKP